MITVGRIRRLDPLTIIMEAALVFGVVSLAWPLGMFIRAVGP